ncbi:hypothetical protein [Paractinoplanes brasiliensis]|uniref:Uncharacterized protein n=1 Tax=Paractinoplanes brasiliensis TaxID=52695 RepID=A0A4R6JUM9_9ACTN|nr:hypothetical protein [Actinoplanes brasiliensis]TDO38355.1 hypothetical protein C8E87_2008 [Actinoplanes brasiliensis]GID26868.1 hypothetical protein Abr02nite_18510 [Actinoplanes brasiliensis]
MPNSHGPTRRWAGAAAASMLVSALAVAVTPGAALAATPCPPGTIRGIVGGYAYLYSLVGAVPAFNVSDSRSVTNNLDQPAQATFTSQVSKTFSISVTAGTSASLFGFLTTNLSSTIQRSRTTAIGVSTTAVVPPHGRVVGEYGVEAYLVTYDVQEYRWVGGLNACTPSGPLTRATANAPTTTEGWRLSNG